VRLGLLCVLSQLCFTSKPTLSLSPAHHLPIVIGEPLCNLVREFAYMAAPIMDLLGTLYRYHLRFLEPNVAFNLATTDLKKPE
jgi:hypothetical protein